MRYVACGLIILVITILFIGVFSLLRKPAKTNEQTVILPKLLPIVGSLCSGVFLIPSVILLFLNESVLLILGFIAFSLLGSSLIIAYINCRIAYSEQSFTVKNFWGIKRTYTYDEITAIQEKSMDLRLCVGKRIIRLDGLSIGNFKFLSFAKKQYRKFHNGNSIPTVKPKADIFNGNVERAGEFIFIYLLIGVFFIGILVYFAIASAPKTAEDLEYKSLSFERYEIQDENLLLYENGNLKSYGIPAYKELLSDADEFLELCENKTSFDIGFIIFSGKDDPYYELESIIGNDGKIYLTMEDIHEYHWGDAWRFYLIFGGMTVVWFVFTALSIYVGRHPEKFSRRFIRLFFKDGYVHIPSENNKKR